MRDMILEAAHSYLIYTTFVPNARLLKWADVLLYVDPIVNKDGLERDQAVYGLKRELRNMVYEPMAAMANAMRLKINHPDMNTGADYVDVQKAINEACTSTSKAILDPNADVLVIKADLIKVMNLCFKWLNKVQSQQYPEIKSRLEMLDGRLH